MSAFTDFTAYELISGERTKYHLTAPMCYEIGQKGSGWWLEIEAGTEFDISVPRWLEWVQSPHDPQVLLASLVHDELGKRGFGVAFASSEFRRACQALGSKPVKAWSLFFLTLSWTAVWRLVHWGSVSKSGEGA